MGICYFAEAVDRVGKGSRAGRVLASLTGAALQPSINAVANLNFPFEEMPIILTALGLRFPERREGFFAIAKKLNVDPSFPRHLIG